MKDIDFDKLTFIEFEWIVIMIAMGYAFLKSELAYENTGFQRYIYITFACFMVFIYSLKVLGIFNIFRLVNQIPTNIKTFWNYMTGDYKYWRLHGQRKSF